MKPDRHTNHRVPSKDLPSIDVVAAVIRDDAGRILITQRPRGGHLEFFWEFPGGKRRAGEDPREALQRELREELDIEIEVGDPILGTEHAYPERVVRLQFFQARHVSGTPRAIEVEQFRWVAPGDLERYEFPEADRDLVRRLRGS
jgi:mutator protein MutT